MKIGIIGCGAIGSAVIKAMEGIERVEKTYVYDRKKTITAEVLQLYSKTSSVDSIEVLIEKSDLIIETASQEAAKSYIPLVLEKGKDAMMMSAGAMADPKFRERVKRAAQATGARLYIPSGGICGIDGISAASQGDIKRVELITVKHPRAYRGVKYLEERRINLDTITEPTVLYKGPADEAARNFPKNVNIAATISLAGKGFKDTLVTVIADPSAVENTHKLLVQGDFGKIAIEIKNNPSPKNPSTSYIAVLSAVSAVKKLLSDVWVGI